MRHLDNRRSGRPCDYLENPHTFGTRGARWVMPDGGDESSMRIARRTHNLVMSIRARRLRGAPICRRWGFGRDLWCEVMAGRRWPGETVLVAMIDALTAPDD